ncbi:polysaccharide deacetylase family protein [Aquicoccus sp. SCR17]|nr:polysaccharide deacetylase family protein [Carideicomes alvinocaridis]
MAQAFNFHGIGVPGRKLEIGEKPYWIEPEDFRSWIEALKHVRSRELYITFDDGNRSDIEIAAPILRENNLTARFFVLTGRLRQPGSLDPADLRDLSDMGFTIGSHGIDHIDWSKQDARTLDYELNDSRNELEAILGSRVTEVAIPFGRYRRHVLQAIRRAGYAAAWTSDGGAMNPNHFVRPRLSVARGMDLQKLPKLLENREGPEVRIRRRLSMARKRFC